MQHLKGLELCFLGWTCNIHACKRSGVILGIVGEVGERNMQSKVNPKLWTKEREQTFTSVHGKKKIKKKHQNDIILSKSSHFIYSFCYFLKNSAILVKERVSIILNEFTKFDAFFILRKYTNHEQTYNLLKFDRFVRLSSMLF